MWAYSYQNFQEDVDVEGSTYLSKQRQTNVLQLVRKSKQHEQVN